MLHYCSLLWTWSGFGPSIFWPSLGCGLGIEDHSKKSRLTTDLLPKDWSSVMPFGLASNDTFVDRNMRCFRNLHAGILLRNSLISTLNAFLCFSPSFVHVHTLSTWKRIMTSLQAHPFMCASLRYRTFVRWSRLWTVRSATGKLDGMYVYNSFFQDQYVVTWICLIYNYHSHRLSGLYPITNGDL
jgi:hypothetical protein